MTFRLVDRVRETAISPGTGTAVLAGAALGYQTFSAGVGANNTTYYVIADQSGANWEVGYGTVGALGTTLARTTVLSSSNAGALVNFSSGTQDVWVDYPATKAVWLDINGDISQAIRNISGITGAIIAPESITFDLAPSVVPTAPGSLYWDAADGNQTLSLVMANGDAIQQIGEEQYFRIKASAPITEGQVVMFTGTVGASGGLTGAPATGLTASTASYVMGIATHDLATNDWGYVTSFGLVRGINTTGGAESWVDGQILYLDPTVAGGLTKTLPTAPNPKVQVAAVVYAASNGSLFVRSTFGGILGQYEGDVQITSPANGNLLVRNQTTGSWVNALLGAGTGFSVTNGAGSVSVGASVADIGTWMATPSSANLLAAMTDETGTGSLVFATSPTLVTPNLGTPSTLVGTNITGTASGLSIGGNAATATTATNQSGGTVAATTGSFSGLITSLMGNNTRIFNAATATTGYQYFQMANTGANLQFGIEGSTAGTLVTGDSAYDAIFTTANNTGITFGVNNAKIFRLQSAGADVFGQLGVTGTLSVGGQITSTNNGAFLGTARGGNATYAIIGNTGGNFFIGRDDSAGGIIGGVAYAPFLWANGSQPMLFATNGSERYRINAGGGVSIGTTTDSGNTNLLVAGTITSNSTSNTGIATGTTAQRPGSPTTGMFRMNTTTGLPEFYNGTVWISLQPSPYSIDTLIVAGGGGGLLASGAAGGSGAGGYLEGSFSLSPGTAYTVTIGAGGTGSSGVNTTPSVGSNSVFNSATALGGGTGSGNNITGQAGGSGGGAGGYAANSSGRPNTAATQTNSNGLTGYGNTGGTTYPTSGGNYGGSGGGGAGAVGVDCTNSVGGNGGAGLNWQSLGTTYAGGGGGGHESGTSGTGGAGGGGNGGTTSSVATNGTANRGGGAGGSASGYTGTGASGGSGIVIIRYLGTQRGSGGTVTSAGGYTYHTFTSSGTYTA